MKYWSSEHAFGREILSLSGGNSLAVALDCGVCALYQPIRLETRTKEFNMCASHWVL